MSVMTKIMLVFSLLGAFDRILGNRFGIGREFEKGFMLMGTMVLSMVGMIVISPWIADALSPVFAFVWDVFRIDPSIIPAMFFANDMGGAQLAVEVAESEVVGRFNALIVSSMMGATVSFSIPYALGVVEARQHKWLLLGLLCGIVMIPFGCLVSGLMLGLSIGVLIFNLLPLQLFSVVIAIGLVKFPDVCVKIFSVFAVFIRIVITIGLAIGIVAFMTGRKVLQNTATLEEGVAICLNASVVMSGAFPLIHVVSKVLAKPLHRVGEKIGVNESSAIGFLSTLATNVTTFGIMGKMDEKGVMLNSAFAVSAAFVFAGHLAFTVAFDAAYLPAMMVGKLIAGLLALLLANIIYKRVDKARQTGDEVLAR